MGKTVTNTAQLIEKSKKCINSRYDIRLNNALDIEGMSKNSYELIVYGFRFGYMQGMKAAKAESKKGNGMNELKAVESVHSK